jgi:HD-like signal output (HDOD) protein
LVRLVSGGSAVNARGLDAEFLRALQDIDIPPRPTILERIRHEMGREQPNARTLGLQISADVGLAAGVVSIANSPYFGCHSRSRSIHEALLVLGLEATARAVAAISLRLAFPNTSHYERFWDASAQIAALSGWLAQTVRRPGLRADDAYTYGLFRDCGIVILLRHAPGYMKALERANCEAERSFTDVEEDILPFNHSVVGCLMAQNWWLAEEMCLAIRHHHDLAAIAGPESGVPAVGRSMIAVSQLAEHLLQRATGASRTSEWDKLGAGCLGVLGLDQADLADLYDEGAALVRRNR